MRALVNGEMVLAGYSETIEKDTSVKSIGFMMSPNPMSPGVADMCMNPVYSVFDYGTIKPVVPLDNTTVNLMLGFNFKLLEKEGIDSHFISFVQDEGGEISVKKAIKSGIAPALSRVKFVNRLMPEHTEQGWDYSKFKEPEVNNFVLPIEFITRNELPESSSVWKRVAAGKLTMEDLGLPADFKPGDKIPQELQPILDYSTKFEPEDRYINAKQTLELLGISQERFDKVNATVKKASEIMTDYAASRGFKRLDGKVEFITYYKEGMPTDILGDAVCTWHEDRLTAYGLGISKQRLRDKEKSFNKEWYEEINRSKKQAEDENVADFRTLMNPNIKHKDLPAAFIYAVNDLFKAGTNMWIGEKVYPIFGNKKESLANNLERAVNHYNMAK